MDTYFLLLLHVLLLISVLFSQEHQHGSLDGSLVLRVCVPGKYAVSLWENKSHSILKSNCDVIHISSVIRVTCACWQSSTKHFSKWSEGVFGGMTSKLRCSPLYSWFSELLKTWYFPFNSYFPRHLKWTTAHWKWDELFFRVALK